MKKLLIYTSIGVALAIILFFAVSFFGNPISKGLANKAANDYLKTHYTELELEKERAFYNFKDAKYVVRLQDKNSPDSSFELIFDSLGRLKYDSYGDRELNTFRRYVDFLNNLSDEIANENGFDFDFRLSPSGEKYYRSYLNLDQVFDENDLPSTVVANFKSYAESPSLEDIMENLKKVQAVLAKKKIPVESFSGLIIHLADKEDEDKAETWANAINVFGVPEKVIVDGDMKALKKIYDDGNKIATK